MTASSSRILGGATFRSTHWSVIGGACAADPEAVEKAITDLFTSYWPPLFAYVRRRGHSPSDAEDLTQIFFEQFLRKESLAALDPKRGRFRSYLLVSIQNFLINEWKKGQALKRGGGRKFFSLEELQEMNGWEVQATDTDSAEQVYDRQWAMAVVHNALGQLKQEYRRTGKLHLYESIKGFLSSDPDCNSYVALKEKTAMTEGALRVAVHRLRQRYGQLMREEIARTLTNPLEVEDEIKYLMTVLAG